jgi:hypothetical protein
LKGYLDQDKFRLKILDPAGGDPIYDNNIGLDDFGEPTTVITGGNIIIHR